MNNEINIAVVQSMPSKEAGASGVRRQNGSPVQETNAAKAVRQTNESQKGEPVQPLQQPVQEEDKEPLENVVSDINSMVQDLRRELQFTVDDESGETVVKVIDKETDELIRQIPAQEILELRKRLEEMRGVIFKGFA